MTLYFNKPESPSPKDALCQFWLKSAQQFRRTISKCRQSIFFLFAVTSPWYTASVSDDPPFDQTRLPFNQGISLPRLAEIGTVVLWKKIFFFNFVFVFRSFCYYLRRYMAEIQPIRLKPYTSHHSIFIIFPQQGFFQGEIITK